MSKTSRLLPAVWLLLLCGAPVGAQTDPTISLRYQPPRISDPLDTLLKAQRVRLQQQEIQRRQQEIQQRQQELGRQRQEQAAAPAVTAMKVPPVSALMKPEQFADAGLGRLSEPEMAQLNAWMGVFINAYTKLLYDGFTAEARVGSNLEAQTSSIEDIVEDGEIVRMLDGSEWHVQGGESVHSSLWLAPTEVLVVKAQNSGSALLIHDGEAVHAVRVR
jgi:hypothetical protein